MADLILISEDFEGHRQSYLEKVILRCQESGQNLHIVTNSDFLNIDLTLFRNVRVYLKQGNRRAIFFKARELSKDFETSTIIIWEIERWYRFLFFSGIDCRALAMRPYLNYTSPKSFFITSFKNILNLLLALRPNLIVRRLSIPNQSHFFSKNWVDELPQYSLKLDRNPRTQDDYEINFGVFGSISSRKQPEVCITFAETISEKFNFKVHLSFVGKIHTDIELSNLKSSKVEISIFNEYVDYETYLYAMSACDYILCFYENIGSARTPLEVVSAGARCIFLDSSKRWKGFERVHPNYFIRYKKASELEKKFTYSRIFNGVNVPVDWIPNLITWLDFLVDEKAINLKEKGSFF